MPSTASKTFLKPLVKNIVFQIVYPNLFYIENKIGEFQLKILERFPQSALLYRRQIVFADLGPNVKQENLPSGTDKNLSKKIWQFKSNDVEINITSDSLDISSDKIKTYSQGSNNFRGIIEFVIGKFLETVSIPQFKRIGLRYINECPIPVKNNIEFQKMFFTSFPISRFKIENSKGMIFRAVNEQEDLQFIYNELLQTNSGRTLLVLDLDCSSTNVLSSNYLNTVDKLHGKIKEEFLRSIKRPVMQIMKGGE